MALHPQLVASIEDINAFTQAQLRGYLGDLQQFLREHTRGDEIIEKQSLFERMEKASLLFAGAFAAGLLIKNVTAAKRAINADNELIKFNIKNAGGLDKFIDPYLRNNRDSALTKIEETFLTRNFPGTHIGTGQRIKNIADGSHKVVMNIINLGIKEGKPAIEIGKDIEAYVKPNPNGRRIAPWTISRREFGRPVSYIPKGIPAGSVEYNAYRIAVSETAATYQLAPQVANDGKWYTEGYIWVLSRSHPKIDRCDDYAAHDEGIGLGVWRKIPKFPHPHCLCHTQTKTVNTAEMVDWLNRLNWN